MLAAGMLLVLALPVPAQEPTEGVQTEPYWVLYARGAALLQHPEGDRGTALQLFLQALEAHAPFPEAEMAIGDVYRAENELPLAEMQYKKAYEQRGAFELQATRYVVLLRLASLYEQTQRYADMEQELLRILADQPYYHDPANEQFRDAFLNTYLEKGLDQLFLLYRVPGVAFATEAHARLGRFYTLTGRNEAAMRNALFAADIIVTQAMEELRRHIPDYTFTTLEGFLRVAFRRENVRDYLDGTDFFETLYYLAMATYQAGKPARAAGLWRKLAGVDLPYATLGLYRQRSARQLRSPTPEPRINPSARSLD